MSNYIYNDDFDTQSQENVKIIYNGRIKKRAPIVLIICTSVMLLSGLLVFAGGLLSFLSSDSDNNIINGNTPEIEIDIPKSNTSLVSMPNGNSKDAESFTNAPLSYEEVASRVEDSVVTICDTNDDIRGSGVLVGKFETENGKTGYYILTNAHVIQGSNSSTFVPTSAILNDGTEYKTEICAMDSKSDIAVLKIYESQKELSCAVWAHETTQIRNCEEIITIGNGTATVGRISETDREAVVGNKKINLMLVDATVHPGNSGGAVFNMNCELIGIVNTSVVDDDVQGFGFVVPHNHAFKAYDDLTTVGYIKGRPTIGAEICVRRDKLIVCNAEDKSVLKNDDIIFAYVDDEGVETPIKSAQDIEKIVESMEIGDSFDLRIKRGAENKIVTVVIHEYTK